MQIAVLGGTKVHTNASRNFYWESIFLPPGSSDKYCTSTRAKGASRRQNLSSLYLKDGQIWLLKTAKFWSKISIFGVNYQPLESKIYPKVGLLRPKTMPKHFVNNSEKPSKKSRKLFYWPPKLSKMTRQNGQNGHIFDCIFQFSGPFTRPLQLKVDANVGH